MISNLCALIRLPVLHTPKELRWDSGVLFRARRTGIILMTSWNDPLVLDIYTIVISRLDNGVLSLSMLSAENKTLESWGG